MEDVEDKIHELHERIKEIFPVKSFAERRRDMQLIPFTQYLRPNGRKVGVAISRPQEIYDKAMDIIKAGYRFEAEVLATGQVSLTISDEDGDHDIEVVDNGPEVPLSVDRMVMRFHEEILGDK